MSINQTRESGTETAPAPGRYLLDPASTAVGFTARKFGLFTIRGTMRLEHGEVLITTPLELSTVRAVLDAASFTTPMAKRDEHVKSKTLLDVARYPTIEFRSTGLARTPDGWDIRGQLTVHGRTKAASLGVTRWSMTGGRLVVQASTQVNRHDFGVSRMRGAAGPVIRVSIEAVGVPAG